MTAFEEEKVFLQFIIDKSTAVLGKKAVMIQSIAFESIIKTEVFRCCGCFSVTSTLILLNKLFYLEKNQKKGENSWLWFINFIARFHCL